MDERSFDVTFAEFIIAEPNGRKPMNAGTESTIDTKRLIFPALGGLYQSIAPYSYAIIRFWSDRHLSRLYETLRRLRWAGCAECSDAAWLPGAAGLGLLPRRPGIFWRRG